MMQDMTSQRNCRFCESPLPAAFLDLGASPLSNSFYPQSEAGRHETFLPLKVAFCPSCLLVQLEAVEKREAIFNDDYAYFSSFSDSWLQHSHDYARMITKRLGLIPNSQVIEV